MIRYYVTIVGILASFLLGDPAADGQRLVGGVNAGVFSGGGGAWLTARSNGDADYQGPAVVKYHIGGSHWLYGPSYSYFNVIDTENYGYFGTVSLNADYAQCYTAELDANGY